MPKAYWIARVDVHDPETYKSYVETAKPAFARYNAKFLCRGGKTEVLEGVARARNVVIEFPDYAAALACYRSAEYQEALAHRLPHSQGEIVIIEGYDGPQPGEG